MEIVGGSELRNKTKRKGLTTVAAGGGKMCVWDTRLLGQGLGHRRTCTRALNPGRQSETVLAQ